MAMGQMGKSFARLTRLRSVFCRGALAALAAAVLATLAGCATSVLPLLKDARPEFGESGQLHIFSSYGESTKGIIKDYGIATYQWSTDRYILRGARELPYSEFTVHPFEGQDRLLQIFDREKKEFGYFVLREISQGAYSLIPAAIHEPVVLEKLCGSKDPITCRITTREQLDVFARAGAHNNSMSAQAVVLLVDRKPQKQ
jgi:hypothetical protein